MSTKKKISDIDKAIEEMQQRRDECFKHIGKAMYESCPELGDMSVADMRKAGHYLHPAPRKGCPGCPVPNGMLRRVVGGSWLGMGRIWGFEGGSENCPLASGTCNDKTEEFSTL